MAMDSFMTGIGEAWGTTATLMMAAEAYHETTAIIRLAASHPRSLRPGVERAAALARARR